MYTTAPTPMAPKTKITPTTISKILMNAPPPPVAAAGAGAALAAAAGEYVGGAEAGVTGAPCAGAEGDGVEGDSGVAARAPHLVQKTWPSLSGDPQLVQNAAMLVLLWIRCVCREQPALCPAS